MKAKAKRSKTITVTKEIEIISHRLSTPDTLEGGSLWVTLKRKCVLCNQTFGMGDSVSLCLYSEDGEQYSGGCHTRCLPGEIA